MSATTVDKLVSYEEERGTMHSIQILTADGRETVLNSGAAVDPLTGLTADLAAVFS